MIIYPEEYKQNIIERIGNTLRQIDKENLNEDYSQKGYKLTAGPNPGKFYTDRVQRQYIAQYLQSGDN
jgi:hypothetical protein